MSFSPPFIINPQIAASRRGISMPHLPLHVQQIGVVPNRVHRIRIAELMRRQMADFSPLAQLAQILPHSPSGEASPLAPAMGDKQGIKSGRQGQIRAHFEPVFNILCGFPVENNDPVLMGLSTSNERGPMAFLDCNILNGKLSQFANSQPGIQRQRPQRQAAHVKPVTFSFIGCGFQVAKELLQFLTPRRAGQQFGVRWLLGKFDGVGRQLAAFIEPRQPNLDGLVIAFDTAFFEAAAFAIVEKCVNAFWGWRPLVAGEGTELMERGFVIKDGLFGLAGFGVQEIGNGPIKGIGVIKLNKC